VTPASANKVPARSWHTFGSHAQQQPAAFSVEAFQRNSKSTNLSRRHASPVTSQARARRDIYTCRLDFPDAGIKVVGDDPQNNLVATKHHICVVRKQTSSGRLPGSSSSSPIP
jgi:hypothetical protein